MTDSPEPQYPEVAIEPSLPIIDTHHHLWLDRYPKTALLKDLNAGHNIVTTVFVDCHAQYRTTGPEYLAPVGETEWVMTQRGADGAMAAIVSGADMALGPQVGETLDAHLEAGGDVFKGVRYPIAWDPEYKDPAMRDIPARVLFDPVVQSGIAELDKRGLIFETWCYFHQLGDIAALAELFPNLSIVVNHLGGPAVKGPYAGHRPEMLEEWRRGLQLVAEHENAVLKVGGIGYVSFVEDSVLAGPKTSEWLAEYWKPELLFCIETFGPDRCTFESNYPVDGYLCDYVTLWNTLKRVSADLSADERALLFEGTAKRVYTLP